ncbi:hypothetical protein Hanom_Chr03g00219321 [Helianthus anomalus]
MLKARQPFLQKGKTTNSNFSRLIVQATIRLSIKSMSSLSSESLKPLRSCRAVVLQWKLYRRFFKIPMLQLLVLRMNGGYDRSLCLIDLVVHLVVTSLGGLQCLCYHYADTWFTYV